LSVRYYINYRLGNENVKVADYNTATETFTLTDYATGRLEVSATQFTVNGTAAITCDAGLVTVANITHLLAPRKSGVPYIEILRKVTSVPKVVAALSKTGTLYVDRVNEDDLPDTTDQLKLGGASFSQNGLTAPDIEEV
jgi:hypothetical protein